MIVQYGNDVCKKEFPFTCENEIAIWIRSQRIFRTLMTSPVCDGENVILQEVRSHWIVNQRAVYNALQAYACTICYNNVYKEYIANQHDERHPLVCIHCFERLEYCPFCRIKISRESDRKIWPRILFGS